MIPTFMHVKSEVMREIKELTETTPNDMDLGKAVRKVIHDYMDGKYNPPSDIEFDGAKNLKDEQDR
jgi:hypothetical protein